MGPIEQQEIPFEGKRLRNLKRRRGIFLLPAMMTSANLLCGYYAVVASLIGAPEDLDRAAKAIGLAILFDSLDGRIARMTGTSTEFGVQFDSLADVVSFGIAPAILAYAWGFRSVTTMAGEGLHQLGEFAWVGCLAFLICCAWRLARFNVQGMAPGSSKYFVGMPTPAAAAVIASIVHGLRLGGPMPIGPLQNGWWSVGWFILAAALGALMTSTIRYYSFKDIPWARKQPSLAIVLVCLLVAVMWRYSEYALMTISCTYAIVGVTLHLIRFFRLRLVSRTV